MKWYIDAWKRALAPNHYPGTEAGIAKLFSIIEVIVYTGGMLGAIIVAIIMLGGWM